MFLTVLLSTAGVAAGVFLIIFGLYLLHLRFRPSVNQLPATSPNPAAKDPAKVLRTIPVVGYTKNGGFEECSVCLSSVEEGEKVRILPGCGHGFHAQCIDEWLCSQLRCPFCRSPVTAAENPSDIKSPAAVEPPAGLRSLMCIKMAFWQRPSPRDDDGSNGGGESGHERGESSPVPVRRLLVPLPWNVLILSFSNIAIASINILFGKP